MRYEWGLAIGHTYAHKDAVAANSNVLQRQRLDADPYSTEGGQIVQPASIHGSDEVLELPLVPTRAEEVEMQVRNEHDDMIVDITEGNQDGEGAGEGDIESDSEGGSDDSDGDCSGLEGDIDELEDERELALFGDEF